MADLRSHEISLNPQSIKYYLVFYRKSLPTPGLQFHHIIGHTNPAQMFDMSYHLQIPLVAVSVSTYLITISPLLISDITGVNSQ